ncbi:MAG: hypothetical protein KDD40_00185 [Bdellovibrionales bacterium]|nr:hypothetical protein [Bdellovibrionales bacterium]
MSLSLKIFCIVFLFFPSFALAQVFPDEAKGCKKPAQKLLQSWQSLNQWKNLVKGDNGFYRYSSPTQKLAQWIYLEVNTDFQIRLIALQHQFELVQVII